MTIQKSKWVKVTDALPTQETAGSAFPTVLCWNSSSPDDAPFEADLEGEGVFYIDERGPADLTHWRPMPEPPPENEW